MRIADLNEKHLHFFYKYGIIKNMEKLICTNKKAYHEYEILETYEAGIQLLGTEVKAVREYQVSLNDSFAKIENGEAFLVNCHIAKYRFGNKMNHEPKRTRKLLLHKSEINRLFGKTQEKGLTLIPLKLYFKDSKVKLELGVAKGKKLYDKREKLRKKIHDREVQRAIKRSYFR
jgi:SsrA-binding protein